MAFLAACLAVAAGLGFAAVFASALALALALGPAFPLEFALALASALAVCRRCSPSSVASATLVGCPAHAAGSG